MVLIELRRMHVEVEEIRHEFGPPPEAPAVKGFVAGVIANPYADRYEPDIAPLMKPLSSLGLEMSKRLVEAMGGDAKAIQSYGKGAIVGTAGELEHGALWHYPGGWAMREVLGGTKAIVPSTKKVGGPGSRLDVPLMHINAAYVRSHFDAIEAGVPGAPHTDEIVFILAMAKGARVHARVGGLAHHEIKGQDGLR
jgi:Amino acid synthesis